MATVEFIALVHYVQISLGSKNSPRPSFYAFSYTYNVYICKYILLKIVILKR